MTSLSQKSINNSLTRANSAEIANFAMPSSKFTNLALQTSGTQYLAAHNGYFAFGKQSTAGGQRVAIFNLKNGSDTIIGTSIFSNGSGNNLMVFMPVQKGDVVNVTYTAAGSLSFFYFVYAEGDS